MENKRHSPLKGCETITPPTELLSGHLQRTVAVLGHLKVYMHSTSRLNTYIQVEDAH